MTGKYYLKHVFYFHCALDILEKRLTTRGESSGRQDDTAEVIKTRLERYATETRPVVEIYTKTNKIVHINCQRTPERVFEQLSRYIEQIIIGKEIRLPEVLFFSGGIASGKRTQMAHLKEKYGFCTMDCSEVLRAAAESDEKIKKDMAEGNLVDSVTVVDKLVEEMDKHQAEVYLITGFPKSMENMEIFNQKTNNMVHIKAFFDFDCCEETMLKRLTARGRECDNVDAFKTRFANFKQSTKPLCEYFKKLDKLVKIDAEAPIEVMGRQINAQIDQILFGKRIEKPKVVFVVGGPGAGKVL